MGPSLIAGIVIVLLAGTIGAADFMMVERPRQMTETAVEEPVEEAPAISSSAASGAASSEKRIVKKGVSTKKQSGVNIENVLAGLQLITQETNEASFLSLTAQSQPVKTVALIRNNDRAFLFPWLESDDVKAIFSALKQVLQEQFSPDVRNLVDETRSSGSGPVVDILSFTDPTLSTERILFLRIRNRLYELHIAENGEEVVDQLVGELSK